LIKFTIPLVWKKLVELKDLSFYILIANVYIATSDASTYIRSNLNSKIEIIFLIAVMSAFLCVFFFVLGWFLGGKKYAHEASQSLGQKNNAFTIWLSLTYMNPISVLGPVFYVLFQNIYISWELYKHRNK
jgi:BASS family bile acid:Na+ symporter